MKKQLIPREEQKINCMDVISQNYKIDYWEIMKNKK